MKLETYFNTTSEVGVELKKSEIKALTQNQQILNFYREHKNFAYSASIVHRILKINCPLTSIRRAITTLYKDDLLSKTEDKIIGLYGRKEYKYKIR